MWENLIQKAKDGGLDVIDTYVFWNGQEPSPGNYNFEGRYDLVRFVKLVQKAGMYMHLRIGPLVCAEWNFGGFPVWLNYVPGISFRTDNELFKVYDGAWTIIEKDSYRVVLQVLLNEQESLFCTLLFIEEDFKEVILPNQISEQHTRISGQRALDRCGFPPPLSLSVQQLWILQLLMRLQLNLSNGSEASLISGENPKSTFRDFWLSINIQPCSHRSNKVYDGAWTLIEEDSYRVVLEVLLNEQESLFCTLLFIEKDFKEVILPN